MSTHAHFEELCVLATSGQLSAAESEQLNQHLLDCDSCRSFLKDAHFISTRVIPQAGRVPREARTPAGMRERFLARATSEGFEIHAGAPMSSPTPAIELQSPVATVASSHRFLSPRILFTSLQQWQAWTIGLATCAVCFAFGFLVRMQLPVSSRASSDPIVKQVATPHPAVTAMLVPSDSDRLRSLALERDQLTGQVTVLVAQLAGAKKEKDDAEAGLQKKLSSAHIDAAHDHESLTQQVVALSSRVTDLQTQLDIARRQQLLAETDLKNARARNLEYSTRLDLLQAQMRSQEMVPMANSDEVSSLVAARNLHIIDVYDSNATGKRQPSFGRVFYVEGRSLVFYAYDLTAAHAQKNITFRLWGEKAGSKETTLSLGILRDDDPKERRWAFTCDDPKLLAKINSVYVTAEMNNRQSDTPRGPRVLYAYFGAPPNHP